MPNVNHSELVCERAVVSHEMPIRLIFTDVSVYTHHLNKIWTQRWFYEEGERWKEKERALIYRQYINLVQIDVEPTTNREKWFSKSPSVSRSFFGRSNRKFVHHGNRGKERYHNYSNQDANFRDFFSAVRLPTPHIQDQSSNKPGGKPSKPRLIVLKYVPWYSYHVQLIESSACLVWVVSAENPLKNSLPLSYILVSPTDFPFYFMYFSSFPSRNVLTPKNVPFIRRRRVRTICIQCVCVCMCAHMEINLMCFVYIAKRQNENPSSTKNKAKLFWFSRRKKEWTKNSLRLCFFFFTNKIIYDGIVYDIFSVFFIQLLLWNCVKKNAFSFLLGWELKWMGRKIA